MLMELEKAGTTWEPQLEQLARNVLLQKYTLGTVDEMPPCRGSRSGEMGGRAQPRAAAGGHASAAAPASSAAAWPFFVVFRFASPSWIR